MTIYEAIGIEELLVDVPIPKDVIQENIQSKVYQKTASHYFEIIDSIVLRASISRFNLELQVIEVSLKEPKYIQEISMLIQTAIKYHVLFVFVYDERYLITRRSFDITESTDHVYTEYLSYSTEWLYEESLTPDILCCYQSSVLTVDEDFQYDSSYWKSEDKKSVFFQAYRDIIAAISELNQCLIESNVISLRQICDWYKGHSTGNRLELINILEETIKCAGMTYIDNNIFFDKNVIVQSIAKLENSQYLRTIDRFGRHPFLYFEGMSLQYTIDIEAEILQLFHSNNEHDCYEDQKLNPLLLANQTIRDYFVSVGDYPVLPEDKVTYLLERMVAGDEAAKDILIKSNLRLVVNVAKKYINHGVPLEDLIQEGTIGLIKALEKYDLKYVARLSTYATYWIRQSIQRAICDQRHTIRIPVHMWDDYGKLQIERTKLSFELGCAPSIKELADCLNFKLNRTQELISIFEGDFFSDDARDEEIESVIDSDNLTPFELSEKHMLRETLTKVLHTLTPREEMVIRLRFGLEDGRPRSYEETGKEFNLTRERIRQVEAKALRKLRHQSRSKWLKGYLESERVSQQYLINDNSSTLSPFVDSIIRGFKRNSYRLIEEQPLRSTTKYWLKKNGYERLGQLSEVSLEEIDFLSKARKIDLILCMDMHGLRLRDCIIDEYPSVNDYIKDKFSCDQCGGPLEDAQLSGSKCFCVNCKLRLERILDSKEFMTEIAYVKLNNDILATNLSISFSLSIEDDNVLCTMFQFEAAYIIFNNDTSHRYSEFHTGEDTKKNWEGMATNSISQSDNIIEWNDIELEPDLEKLKYIQLIIKNIFQNIYHMFIYKKNNYGKFELYDYIRGFDYSEYRNERIHEGENDLLLAIRSRLNDIHLTEKREDELVTRFKDELKNTQQANSNIEEAQKPAELSFVKEQNVVDNGLLMAIRASLNVLDFDMERKAAEEAAQLEAERKAAEEAAQLEAERKAAEEAARLEAERKAAEEAARREAERKAAEEAARLEAERKAAEEAARREAERKAAEEAARLEAERKAAEEAVRLEAERKAAEEVARLEAERKAVEEAARLEAERKAAEEAVRCEAEIRLLKERLATMFMAVLKKRCIEEKHREAQERLLAEAMAVEYTRRCEAECKAAEEAARLEAERKAAEEAEMRLLKERLASMLMTVLRKRHIEEKHREAQERLLAEALAVEHTRRREVERKAAEEAARLEAERKAAEEAARLEAERKVAEEAARLEAERKAAEEAARLEAERKAAEETARLEAERRAAEEAARLEAERKAAEEAARREAERKAAEEAARLETEQQKIKNYETIIRKLASNNILVLTEAIRELELLNGWGNSDKVIQAFRNKLSILKKEKEEHIKANYRSQKVCQYCGGKFKGVFKKVCSACGKKKDY